MRGKQQSQTFFFPFKPLLTPHSPYQHTHNKMAFRAATQRALNMRHMMNVTRQPITLSSVRPQSTLNTGEVVEDPQIGDYPNLPRFSTQTRGPYGWDDAQDKRNFGETVRLDYYYFCI